MAKNTIILTAYNMGPDATEEDFDSWASFVAGRIDDLFGEEVSVEQHNFGEQATDFYRLGNDPGGERQSNMDECLRALWEEWCSEPTAAAS